ncbi:MAG: hypothetical protein WCK02_15770 [Bacteroidota bacterium]
MNNEKNELVIKPQHFMEQEFSFDALLKNELSGIVAGAKVCDEYCEKHCTVHLDWENPKQKSTVTTF